MMRLSVVAGCIGLIFSSLYSGDFEEFVRQQSQAVEHEKDAFTEHKAQVDEAFKKYQAEINKAYQEYKKEISRYWDDPRLPSQKEWVSYESDKKTRTAVDFDAETIIIETIAENEDDAKVKLQRALAKVVTEDVSQAQESDPLTQKIDKINQKNNAVQPTEKTTDPLLASIIFKKTPTAQSVKKYVQKHTEKIRTAKSKIKKAKVYSVAVDLPPKSTQKRSKIYFAGRRNSIQSEYR